MRSNHPRISIIVATFNAASTLQNCLNSILEQDFQDIELLVADADSQDGTVDILELNSRHLAWWVSEPDKGIYDAWNKALSQAKGEYVMFLGADDALNGPLTLSRIFQAVGSASYDLVSGRGALIDDQGRVYHEFGYPWNFRAVQRRMRICHPGALHCRELFDRFGKFDTTYRICADYEFILRLPIDLRTLFIDYPLVRISDGGISRKRRIDALREVYTAQSRCPRIGRAVAAFNFLDKLWRLPAARLLGMPN